ncbi:MULTISPECIES: orotidine-5'-phosphate decarboxylase [Roseobacteraceae]|jgi:orotidine-5'-phosphate decarboxylase|nr:orotidine-5'-phosphate decarboxylase [Phaeobacter gallaeciensis]MDE4100274.1 orotidine-5'-phosphate decarboxylase [Phaeobacter gallaeciensis]MDE4109078.1 orotidine-5'-phosphate decarboxylase [Phaeobacter gallaeciensis]MDE4113542.1 orotidine-5'-phosphate decarboxylase [Phaeobacter gallaeciensis]MDE4118010.1 orotidine-5'-phosphate decarboxylase [Phaeobacter gallaeciensis]MDE4122491.1 orotidine-5'-phosphate decarboxylase [Phaeobacter gallaeciensis]
MKFFEMVANAEEKNISHLCIGLDPRRSQVPQHIQENENALFDFCAAIVDATKDLASSYKPQIAYFAAEDACDVLKSLIDYIHDTTEIPVILDAKRGDIESTTERYAVEAFEVYQADAVTANPYLGIDGVAPFTQYADKGVFVLCKTSNDSAPQLQDCLLQNGQRLYEHVAELASSEWNRLGNVGLVVGATMPEEALAVREIVGQMPLLIPGVGAQGGSLDRIIAAAAGGGILINSARAINYAGSGENFAQRARGAAMTLRNEINEMARQKNKEVFVSYT